MTGLPSIRVVINRERVGRLGVPPGSVLDAHGARGSNYALRNVEESRGDEHEVAVPDRDVRERLRPGQIIIVLFLDESGAAPAPAGVVIVENRNDAYVGHLLDPDDAAAHCPSGLIAFGPEHVAHLFDGDITVGTQQLSHYADDIIALGVDDVASEDLRILNHFPYLYKLSLKGTPVADLTFLRQITSLEVLNLDDASVSDLTPVRALVALNTLFASRTSIEDLEPLTPLHALEGLRLSHTPVCDLTPIRGLRRLKYLNVGALAGHSLTSVDVRAWSGREYSIDALRFFERVGGEGSNATLEGAQRTDAAA